jgi:hypothetical protein
MINYIGPERQLRGGAAPSTEQIINQLLDKVFVIAEDFRYTHSKESLIGIIQVIVSLNKLGYDFIWDRRRHIVGAHKKTATLPGTQLPPQNTNAVQILLGGATCQPN